MKPIPVEFDGGNPAWIVAWDSDDRNCYAYVVAEDDGSIQCRPIEELRVDRAWLNKVKGGIRRLGVAALIGD